MYTPIIQNRIKSAIEMELFHIAQTTFFLGTILFLHLVGPSEQFGTHEIFSCERGAS